MSEEVNWQQLAEGFRLERNIMQEMSVARECHDGNSLEVHNNFCDAHCLVCERMNAITADNKKEMVGQ